MVMNVTGRSIFVGISLGISPLAGQANGAKAYHRVAEVYRRGFCVMCLIAVPLSVLWFFTAHALVALKQDPEISAKAGLFARVRIIGMFFFVGFVCTRSFLRAQLLMMPIMYVTLGVTALNIVASWGFTAWLGYIGAPMAVTLCDVLSVVFCVAIIKYLGLHRRTWGVGWSRESLRGWGEILRNAAPAIVMLASEWWASEIMTLLAGVLGKTQAAVQPSLFNACAFFFNVPLGVSVAGSSRLANLLGAGKGPQARLCCFVFLATCMMTGAIGSSFFLIFRRSWGRMFSSDDKVIAMIADVTPLVVCYVMLDCAQITLSSVLRGTGMLKVGAIVNFLSFYLVGIPLGGVCAFKLGYGIHGLWYGLLAGMGVQSLALFIITLRIDWDLQVCLCVDTHADNLPQAKLAVERSTVAGAKDHGKHAGLLLSSLKIHSLTLQGTQTQTLWSWSLGRWILQTQATLRIKTAPLMETRK